MAHFKNRSDYIKAMCINHQLVAHGALAPNSKTRQSFFRYNDWEELNAGIINCAHFPAVCYVGASGRYTGDQGQVPKRKMMQQLAFFWRITTRATDMNALEEGYDIAFQVMEDFISWMYAESRETGACGPFRALDLSRMSFSPASFDSMIVGWTLTFEEEAYLQGLGKKDPARWTSPQL